MIRFINNGKFEDMPEYNACLNVSKEILGAELPYIPLAYIESDKNQWIDTGIVYKNTYSLKTKFKYTNSSDRNGDPFGTRTVANGSAYKSLFISTYQNCWLAWGSTEVAKSSTHINNNEWEVYINKNKVYFNDSLLHTFQDENFETSGSLYLFGEHYYINNDNYISYKSFSRIYYFQIFDESGALLIDLIPVKRKSDNEICMYDRVSGQYFTNKGTGTFIAGTL